MTQTLNSSTQKIKFLYGYGGILIPRRSDGQIRYVGGLNRVLSVDRSITYSELMVKFVEACGFSTVLKCKLPNEDLDQLITIRSDEELQSLIGIYERASALDRKIRAVLFPVKSAKEKKISPPSSPMSCLDFPARREYAARRCTSPAVVRFPISYRCFDEGNWSLHCYSAQQRGCFH